MESEAPDEAATGNEDGVTVQRIKTDGGDEGQGERTERRNRERRREKAEKAKQDEATAATEETEDLGDEAQGDRTEQRTRDRKKERTERTDRNKTRDLDEAEDLKQTDGDAQDKKGKSTGSGRVRRGPGTAASEAQPSASNGGAASAEQWGQTLKDVQVQLERLAAAQEDMQKTLSILASGGSTKTPVLSHAVIHGARTSPEKKRSQRQERTSQQSQLTKNEGGIPEEDQPAKDSFSEDEVFDKQHSKGLLQAKDRSSMEEREMAAALAAEVETQELRSVFVEADRKVKELEEKNATSYIEVFRNMSIEEKSNVVDLVLAFVICLNMIVIGLSMDMEGSVLLLCIDVLLTTIFIGEICIKILLHGFAGHFCPRGFIVKVMCWSDAAIVAIDIMQLSVQLATWGDEDKEGSSVRTSVLRVFRLARLARFIRLLRMEAFHDLMMMVTGLVVGMPTLAWAIVLLLIIFYVLALASRLALGVGGPMEIRQEFDSVESALFAVFRCSFGDCNTRSGVSLLGMVIDHYGVIVGVFSCLTIFLVTIGMFNVISAIFVQGTMTAWFAHEEKEKMEKLNDFSRFSENMKKLLVRVFERSHEEKAEDVFRLDAIEEWKELEITTADFKEACEHDEIVKDALRELQIHEGDLPVLSDILDPQNDLKLTIMEIMHGIIRLRGDPRRSDIVTIDLMVRDIQKSVGKLLDRLS